MSGWGCPHEDKGECTRLNRVCDPGMRGCILHGRFRFANNDKNRPDEADSTGKDDEIDAPDKDRQ